MKRYNGCHLIFAKLWLLVFLCGFGAPRLAAQTPVNFKIAFIGDQGSGSNATAVLNLIKNEGAHAVVHQGDFDYNDNPAAWDGLISSVLGANFPYFASAGNHDDGDFYGSGGYQSFLIARMNRLGITWDGDLGAKSSFKYQGIFFVLTAPDVIGSGHDVYIRDKLAADNSIWSISSWHKNMRLMQVGGKGDETGWGVYEQSRKGGAIIATGHEHSYSRTHLLSSCQNQTVASTSNTLVLTEDLPNTPQDEGKTFVFVSGLGGKSVRSQSLSGPWWASIYTSSQGATYGALFGVFNFNGEANKAHFYFKAINGAVPDDFFVISNVTPPDATPPSEPTGLTATVNGEKIDLAWTAASDAESGISGYKLYRGTTTGGETFLAQIGNVTSYTDATTLPNTTYFYQISAVNGAGLEGSRSNEANATTGNTPPAVPTNLTASTGNQEVTLDWSDNSEADLAGYHVYRATTSGGPYARLTTNLLTSSNYMDGGLTNGTTYYYVVTATDAGNNESANSNEANATPSERDLTLIAHWKFDEGSGSTAADASGNNNHGTIFGASWSAGKIGNALGFDGVNDYVTASALTPPHLTVSVWIKLNSTSTWQAIVERGDASNVGWHVYVNSGNRLYSSLGGDAVYSTAGTITTNTWYHVAVTWDGSTVKHYTNGVQTASAALSSLKNVGSKTIIGTRLAGGPTLTFNGLIDDVRIYNRALSVSEIAQLAQLDNTPPSAPSGLNATANGEQVNLSWSAASDAESGISGYKIYRGTTAGGETFLTQLGNVTSYTDQSTAPSTTYFYQVSAVNGAGTEGSKSNEANVLTGNNPPAAPTNLNASAGNGKIMLDWNDNSETDLAGYDVYRATASGGPYTQITTSLLTSSSYTDVGLTNGTRYYYVVTAVDAGGNESNESNEANAVPADNPPVAPKNLIATASNQQIALDWSDNTEPDLAGYHVYRATTSGGPYTRLTTSLLTSSNYTDSGLSNGTTYYYVVTATDAGSNESANSNEANATPSDRDLTLIGHWKFDEGSGSTAADASGNNNHGTIFGASWATGKIGNALTFDGVNDYVTASALTPPHLTVSAWIKLNSTSTWQAIVERGDASNVGWHVYVNSGNRLYSSLGGDAVYSTAGTITTNTWYHVAVTWDGSTVKHYTNGVQTASAALSSLKNVGSKTIIGTRLAGGPTLTFNGLIDDVRIYNRALSVSEIAQLAQLDNTPPSAPSGLSTTANGERVNLSWNAASDAESGISGYKVYRGTTAGGETFLTQLGNVTSYTDQSTVPSTMYFYQVSAVNGAGSEGSRSNEASVVTGNSPPAAPTNLSASAGNQQITLDWSDNSEADLAGYHVYRSTTTGGPYTQLTSSLLSSSTYIDGGLTNGTRYYYVVTAKDAGGNESVNSNEANAIPIDQDITLVSHWKFDEGSGTSVADASGNGNHGTIFGASWTTGKIGNALSFDGVNDYVTASAISPTQLTVSAWIKLNSTATWQCIVERGDASNVGWHVYINSGNRLYSSLGGDAVYSTAGTITTNTWYHVAVTWNGTTVKHYTDGVQTASATLSSLKNVGSSMIIGTRLAGGPRLTFKGLIDDVRLYNRALSASEIQALASSAAPKRSTPESKVDLHENLRPEDFYLEQNYPNPFNPTTVIRYNLPAPVHVKLIITDLLGHKVRTLVDEDEPAGYRHITWDGTNDAGVRVGSGVYLMRIEAGSYRMTRKLLLMK